MATKKILLAEDDKDDQMLFQEFLKNKSDISIMPMAENGEVLLAQLEEIDDNNDLPSLIILDQNMPRKGGLQTLKALKADKRYSHIPVVIYSTYTDDRLVQAGMEAGACAVLSKPLTKEDYNNMLEDIIKACVQP